MANHLLLRITKSYSSFLKKSFLSLLRQIRNIFPLKQLIVHVFTKVNIRKMKNIGKKAPHLSYGEKVDLIKNVFVPEKIFRFPEAIRPFKYE